MRPIGKVPDGVGAGSANVSLAIEASRRRGGDGGYLAFEGFGAGHDFQELFGDRGLAGLIVGQAERAQKLFGVIRGEIGRAHV